MTTARDRILEWFDRFFSIIAAIRREWRFDNHVPVCRKAKAAAKGAPAIAIRVRAQRIRNGVAKGTIEPAPAPAAATPKIRTGTQSGKIKTANNSPPRRRLTVNAAPTAPITVRAGVHATSESVTLQSWF